MSNAQVEIKPTTYSLILSDDLTKDDPAYSGHKVARSLRIKVMPNTIKKLTDYLPLLMPRGRVLFTNVDFSIETAVDIMSVITVPGQRYDEVKLSSDRVWVSVRSNIMTLTIKGYAGDSFRIKVEDFVAKLIELYEQLVNKKSITELTYSDVSLPIESNVSGDDIRIAGVCYNGVFAKGNMIMVAVADKAHLSIYRATSVEEGSGKVVYRHFDEPSHSRQFIKQYNNIWVEVSGQSMQHMALTAATSTILAR